MSTQIDLMPTATATVEEYPNREEWLRARRLAIGASEAPAILGVSPFMSPMQLFAEKLELVDRGEQTEAMEWGQLLEGPMAERYAALTGYTVQDPGRYTLHRSTQVDYLVATLDRVIVRAEDRPTPAGLELKQRFFAKPGEWDEEPPVDVLVQVQHQLAVTGWQWSAVAVLLGGRQFKPFVVQRHEGFIAKLMVAEAAFYDRLVRKDPPPVDGTAATRDVLRALYPKEQQGLVVNLTGDAVEWDKDRLEAIAELKRAELKKTEAENRLLAALGEAEVGILPNGVSFTYKAAERKGYSVAPSVVRTLRRKEPK